MNMNDTGTSLHAKLLATAAGDEVAWAALCRDLDADFLRLTQHLSAGFDIAEDARQEAALAIRSAATQYRPTVANDANAKRFCLGIAAHKTLMLVREHHRRQIRQHEAFMNQTLQTSNDPSEVFQRRETQLLVRDALSEIEEPFRQAVILHHLSGLSCQEVAEIQGVRSITARTRIWRGMKGLRSALARRGLPSASAIVLIALVPLRAECGLSAPLSPVLFPLSQGVIMASIAATLATASVIAWQFLPALEKPTTPVVLTQSAISSTQPRIDWSDVERLTKMSIVTLPKMNDHTAVMDGNPAPLTYLGKDLFAKGQKLGTLSEHDGKSFLVQTDADGKSHEYELHSLNSATIAVISNKFYLMNGTEKIDATVDDKTGALSGETLTKLPETFRAVILRDLRDQPGKPWKGTLNDLPQSIPEDLRKSLQVHLQA